MSRTHAETSTQNLDMDAVVAGLSHEQLVGLLDEPASLDDVLVELVELVDED